MQQSPPESTKKAALADSIELSIIIPAFNEELVLLECLKTVEDYAEKQGNSYEIIVIDDGSSDRTSDITQTFMADRNTIILLNNDRNRGKGYTVQRGMLKARGNLVLFLDADLSTQPKEFDHFKKWFDHGYEVVIGTRRTEGAEIAQNQSFLREKMGAIFKAAQSIFSLQRINDWSFDAEILHISKRQGFRIKEVPVQWKNAEDSKVQLIRDSIRSLLSLLRIRLNSLQGRYDRS